MDILYYRRMLADRGRLRAFHRAIRKTVQPGDVVVEIGAGVGTYSFFAAKAGARRVYAIEADPDICRLAECLAEQNGLSDKIRFLRGYSTDIELPERADVAIFEDFTGFFLSSALPPLLRDIRKRYLKRSGRVMPQGVDLYLAGAEHPRAYRQLDLLKSQREHVLGLDFSETRRLAMNHPLTTEAKPRHLLTPPLLCTQISLGNGQSLSFAFSGEARIRRNALLHGLVGWMELVFAPGVHISCSPLRPSTSWGQEFFPFAEPLRVRKDQQVKIAIESVFPQGISRYIQRWTVSAGTEYREGNTFAGVPLSEHSLNGESANTRGKLGPRSRALLTLMLELKAGTSYGKVAAALVKKHPHLFESQRDALVSVIRLVPALSTVAGEL